MASWVDSWRGYESWARVAACVTRRFLRSGGRVWRGGWRGGRGSRGRKTRSWWRQRQSHSWTICDAFTLLVLYLRVSWAVCFAGDRTKPSNNGRNRDSGRCLQCSPAVWLLARPLRGVVFLLWSVAWVFEWLFISFRMAPWGTLMTWLRSTRSITAPPSATCVKGWRSYGNAK